MDIKPREQSAASLKSYNLRFLATVCSNVSTDKPGTRIQLTTTDARSTEPWSVEMSIDQFDKLYNVLHAAKNEQVAKQQEAKQTAE